ncbi:MAG: signal peptidase I [Candidatus Woesearchaeota archaeon]
MKGKGFWGKLWWFIWEDDSIWSWIVNIVLAFVLIKFIIYPGLGFALQTSHPIVAVVSGSMEHRMVPSGGNYRICNNYFNEKQKVDFDNFWDICGPFYMTEFGISKENFEAFRFRNGFNKGDIMILYSSKNIKPGDVVVYQGQNFPIIHRIAQITDDGQITTVGDHNGYKDKSITDDKLIGKAVLRIPYLGYVKILAVELVCLVNDGFQFCEISI